MKEMKNIPIISINQPEFSKLEVPLKKILLPLGIINK